MKKILFIFLLCIAIPGFTKETLVLKNDKLVIEFTKLMDGWHLTKCVVVGADRSMIRLGRTMGEYALLFSASKPDGEEVLLLENGDTINYLEKVYEKTIMRHYKKNMTAVPLNIAGEATYFYPTTATKVDDALIFETNTEYGRYRATWKIDEEFENDIRVKVSFTASKNGYYSLATPTLATAQERDIVWGSVPGMFWGDGIQTNFKLAYNYAQGLPQYPVQCNESTITTMASILSTKNGLTLATIPDPGQDRNPYEKDRVTHNHLWKISLSHKNRKSELSPTAYHPVLGEQGSLLNSGETVTFDFRYSIQQTDWYTVYKHVIYDIYDFKKNLTYKRTEQSLTERVLKMYDYVLHDVHSMWNVEDYYGLKIGAQSYNGIVMGSDNDAMKNADYGAVWMFAKATNDPRLIHERLPYLRNFKLAQQQSEPGFTQGASKGQNIPNIHQRIIGQ